MRIPKQMNMPKRRSMKSLWICCQVLPVPPSATGVVLASATLDWVTSPAVPPPPPPSVVALPPEPPDGARSTPASATVLPLESAVWPPVPLWPPGPDEDEVAPPWPPVLAKLEEGDVVPPDSRGEEGVLVAPPPWPPFWTELPPAVPPVATLPPVPELPADPVVPPAHAFWFTLGAVPLQARPIAHANRVETSLVFMGVGSSGECDGLEGSFHAQASQSCQDPGWGNVVFQKSVIAIKPDVGEHAA